MSLATLKRKTNQKYNNSSVGKKQFSIVGTTRNQGWVGQTSLSRNFPSTPMKGNTACGHGGSNGAYYQGENIVPGIHSLNDNNAVKSPVIGTKGMIMTKYRWIRRPQPFSVVKLNTLNNQSTFITHKEKNILNTISRTSQSLEFTDIVPKKRKDCGKKICNTVKSNGKISLTSKCSLLDAISLPRTSQGAPIV